MGEKKAHKQNPPKIPGQSPDIFVYVFFLYVCFFHVGILKSLGDMEPRRTTNEKMIGLCFRSLHALKWPANKRQLSQFASESLISQQGIFDNILQTAQKEPRERGFTKIFALAFTKLCTSWEVLFGAEK